MGVWLGFQGRWMYLVLVFSGSEMIYRILHVGS